MKNRAGGSERNDPGSPLRLELLLRHDLACSSGTRRLFYAEECGRRVLICGGEPNLHLTSILVKGDAVGLAALEREPQAERRNVDSLPEAVARINLYLASLLLDISSKGEPSEFEIFGDVGCGRARVAEEVGAAGTNQADRGKSCTKASQNNWKWRSGTEKRAIR